MEKSTQLKALIESAEQDAESFYKKGNKVAGTRLRNAMQSLKTAASDMRKEVTEQKNNYISSKKSGSYSWSIYLPPRIID